MPLSMMVLLPFVEGYWLDFVVNSLIAAVRPLHRVRFWHLGNLIVSKWHYLVIFEDALDTLFYIVRSLHALDGS